MNTSWSKTTRQVVIAVMIFTLLAAGPLLIRIGMPQRWPLAASERFWAHAGSYSMDLTFFTMALLAVRLLFMAFKKYSPRVGKGLGWLFKFFYRHHIMIGYVALVLGVAHSTFYLVKLSPEASDTYTGFLALIPMIAVIVIGMVLQSRKARTNPRLTRYWHTGVGIFFLALLLLHNYYADVHAGAGVYRYFYK